MIFLQSFCSLIVSTLSVVEVLSSSQSQDPVLSGDPYWAPSTAGAVSSDVKNWNQGSLIASGSLQGPNLWPGNSNLRLSNQGGSDTNTPLDIPKDSALLFDGSDGVTNVAPPTFPNPLRVIFPDGLPQFDPAGAIRWFTEPVKPQCDNGKFAFCCQEGPPGFQQKKDKPPATQERKEEIRRRLRKCRNWSASDPACLFPENLACCDCKSELQTAFECYNPEWRDNFIYQNIPRRPPVLLPKSKAADPNPSEPNPEVPGENNRKREWSGQLSDNEEIESTDNIGVTGMPDLLYAENPPSDYRHPGGRERFESTCSDEYLESKDVRPNRYYLPSVHTPENPFVRKGEPRKPKELPDK